MLYTRLHPCARLLPPFYPAWTAPLARARLTCFYREHLQYVLIAKATRCARRANTCLFAEPGRKPPKLRLICLCPSFDTDPGPRHRVRYFHRLLALAKEIRESLWPTHLPWLSSQLAEVAKEDRRHFGMEGRICSAEGSLLKRRSYHPCLRRSLMFGDRTSSYSAIRQSTTTSGFAFSKSLP